MKVKKPEKKASDGNLVFKVVCTAAIIAVVILFFLWRQAGTPNMASEKIARQPLSEHLSVPETIPSAAPPPAGNSIIPTSVQVAGEAKQQDGGSEKSLTDAPSGESDAEGEQDDIRAGEKSASPASCSDCVDTITKFYSHLDQQDYIKAYNMEGGSQKHFTQLIQRLLDNPPIVSGETNDLHSILQNTAHFFRIIGKDNIIMLKAILDREKEQFENVLAQFYSLLHLPSCTEQSFSLKVNDTALYDYAGFFLNTMGGRLYLFRRDSTSRMVVSYYAVLLIDQANKNANNQHGIELRTAIDQLIEEIESTQNILRMKEHYLDSLYTLKEEYQ